jgi:hypothetical protein
VGDGLPESVEWARELVAVVLQDDTVSRAVELDKLLRAQSPLALVRAVGLAESVQVGGLEPQRSESRACNHTAAELRQSWSLVARW